MGDVEKILFVDDDASIRAAFRRTLRGMGFDVDLAEGSEAAQVLAANAAYAIVVTDFRMPGEDGLDVIDKLRPLLPDSTFVLMSAELDLQLAMDAINEHAVSFVVRKPWDREELMSTLKRAVELHWERVAQRHVQQAAAQQARPK